MSREDVVTAKARILVVDDELSMREFLDIFFRGEGYAVETAEGVDAALALIEADDFDLVISDMQMPGRSGLDLLHTVREACPDTVVIMITAFATTDSAVAAMKQGAYDYITKPFKVDEVRLIVEKALEKKLLSRENRRLRVELRGNARKRTIIGSSEPMQRIFDLVDQIANTRTNVLICGESGTGKELIARSMHEESDRSRAPFIAVNCGAIPENLLESELFGHVKGAFTGAIQTKEGLFEAANGGTLFLDEVGELPLSLQVKLLRVLQDKAIRRVGGVTDMRVDVRIVCATNKNLPEEISAHRFREDLYYRLNVIQVNMPALRERPDDIPVLVHHFYEKYAKEFGKRVSGVSDEAMRRLLVYAYPGNVRELENVLERAVALARDELIGVELLPPTLFEPGQTKAPVTISSEGVDLEALMDDYERTLLGEALVASGGVKKRAAKLLRISFRSFRYRLEKLGFDTPGTG